MIDLFIGVVTHARSRFNANGEATNQAMDLAAALADSGVSAQVLISDRDDYDAARVPLSRRSLVASAVHATSLEHRWRRYLARAGGRPARSVPADAAFWLAMTAKRTIGANAPSAIRLLNIDLSHLRVMEAALAEDARWMLVLEDDARVSDVRETAADLARLVTAIDPSPLQFVNLSESLPLQQLGVEGILGGPAADGSIEWLVSASVPVTNTVCANLYRAAFAAHLVEGIRARGLVPVAPIDWRLNEQIMEMSASGTLDDTSCAWAIPGRFLQASMRDWG